ncbi:putative lipoprotein [Dissulfuribacter thermophilus]|uniref:Putative lipoprotein n=1 Tax=Dissulfuribacter thermophilus TaxID=1156395 RepID=A0A1B9F2S9_9BACT|nr:hypothetical protein [Dissulfuribacter thermophilus]OCC14230.1 putative lipoprotein [Dissulfuribacter thermophilus]
MYLKKSFRNICLLWLIFFSFGCAQYTPSTFNSASNPEEETATKTGPTIQYQFPDLPIPMELTKVQERTMIIRTPTYQGGILTYKGRITSDSLEGFFMENLPKHNWIFQGSLHGKSLFLAFSKDLGAQCLIKISDEAFNTVVEIWLSEPLGVTE